MGTPSTTRAVDIESAADMKSLASGLPFITGTWYFVDPTSGAAANDGLSPYTAFASISTAYDACTSGAGDGIAVLARGTTTAGTTSYLTAAITWSKWGITVFGVCANTRFSQRARISTQAANLANLITVSGSNNSFYNLSFYNGGTTGAGGISVTGERNYFQNVHIMGGMGMTTPTVNDYDLLVDGGDENTFVNCVFGNDTFDKTDIAGAEVHFDNGAMRNRFYSCEFISYRSAGTTAAMIKLIGAGDSITRTLLFDNCFFHMYRDGNVTAEATVVIGTAPNNGFIIFKDCLRHGFTDWGAVAATGRVYSGSATQAEAGGITIAANPS
jgi:hypothetical protein